MADETSSGEEKPKDAAPASDATKDPKPGAEAAKVNPETAVPAEPSAKSTEASGTPKAEAPGTPKAEAPGTPKTEAAGAPQPSASVRELTEAEIDSPNRRALVPLYAVFVVTVLSWGAARFACNMHPPESRPPPKLSTDRLAATPKDAAIEAIQRWDSYDFDGALELATGDAAAELQRARADCQAHANDCARQREGSAGLLTMAEVLRNDGINAEARVSTLFKGQKKEYHVRLARQGAIWKVASRAGS